VQCFDPKSSAKDGGQGVASPVQPLAMLFYSSLHGRLAGTRGLGGDGSPLTC